MLYFEIEPRQERIDCLIFIVKGRKMHKLIFGILILMASPALLRAQTENPADPFMASYSKVIPHFPDLHMGGQFMAPHRSVNETSFYLDNGFENGNLVISGFEFHEVPLDYNVWYDVLVTINPIHRQYTLLNHLKVDQFTLSDGSTFVRKDNVPSYYYHKNGFYRQVVKDEIGLYCKHWKELKKRSSIFEDFDKYINKQRYFLEIEGQLLSINKRKDAFQLLNLRPKDLKPRLREEKVKYKRDRERYLSLLVELANQKMHE